MKFLYTFLTLVLLSVFSTQISAQNCECPDVDFESVVNDVDHIFRGTVTKWDQIQATSRNMTFTFNVTNTWKGAETREITLRTDPATRPCGVSFEINKEYLVFAWKDMTSICYPTTLYDQSPFIASLNKLTDNDHRGVTFDIFLKNWVKANDKETDWDGNPILVYNETIYSQEDLLSIIQPQLIRKVRYVTHDPESMQGDCLKAGVVIFSTQKDFDMDRFIQRQLPRLLKRGKPCGEG